MAHYGPIKQAGQDTPVQAGEAEPSPEAKKFAATLSEQASAASKHCVEIVPESPGYYSFSIDGNQIGTLRANPGQDRYGFAGIDSPNKDYSESIGGYFARTGKPDFPLSDKLYEGIDAGIKAYSSGNAAKAPAEKSGVSCRAPTV